MYFSFRRICSILERLHSVFPRGVSTFRRSRASLIWRRLRPSRNRLKIILMCSASSGTISGSPSSPFLYPSILEYGKANFPWLYPFRLPHLTLLLRDSLSPWAKALVHVKNISLVTREVSNPSFSNRMMIPRSFNIRMYEMHWRVFREKRDSDLASIMSIFPFLHCLIISIKPGRFSSLVPLMPSSEKTPAYSHSGFERMRSS